MLPDMGRLQPQARELEEAVLGALMLEKDAYSIVSEILKPECFYEKAHEKIYAAIVDLALSQRPVDMLTVTEQLKKRGELEDVGGPFYISQLTSKVASSAHIEYHARIIAQKYLARELISFTAMIQGKAFDETLDVEDLMQEAEGKLFEISQRNVGECRLLAHCQQLRRNILLRCLEVFGPSLCRLSRFSRERSNLLQYA